MARPQNNGDEDEVEVTDKGMRISITVDPSLRRNMRIAAAYADTPKGTIGEWAVMVLTAAAEKAVPELKGK